MSNDQMIADRYGRWARARKGQAEIVSALQAGKTVIVSTYGKAWQFDKPGHADYFKAKRDGLYMRRGKAWDCMTGASVRIYG